jgi:hypothetical protein
MPEGTRGCTALRVHDPMMSYLPSSSASELIILSASVLPAITIRRSGEHTPADDRSAGMILRGARRSKNQKMMSVMAIDGAECKPR